MDGLPSSAGAAVAPMAPILAAAPPAVVAGIFQRATKLASIVKSRVNYAEADGIDLGIVGAEATETDRVMLKATISLRLINGGHPEIVWKRNGMSAIDIYVRRGDREEWVFLATDTVPNYTDTFALPASGESAVWAYKAIYRADDEQTGQWSDEASVLVKGM